MGGAAGGVRRGSGGRDGGWGRGRTGERRGQIRRLIYSGAEAVVARPDDLRNYSKMGRVGAPTVGTTQQDLDTNGWCLIPPVAAITIADVLSPLGPISSGQCDLKPYSRESAPRGSMSSVVGTDKQPMHTDAAYRPQPPRYIALQCVDPGEAPCPTHVWTLNLGPLSKDRPDILTKTTWIAHGQGHVPFYCSIMDTLGGRVRVRFDPLCMRPMSGANKTIAEAQEFLDFYSKRIDFDWDRGALLIIDNWRCLHARGNGASGAPSRRLRRWTIGARNGLVT